MGTASPPAAPESRQATGEPLPDQRRNRHWGASGHGGGDPRPRGALPGCGLARPRRPPSPQAAGQRRRAPFRTGREAPFPSLAHRVATLALRRNALSCPAWCWTWRRL